MYISKRQAISSFRKTLSRRTIKTQQREMNKDQTFKLSYDNKLLLEKSIEEIKKNQIIEPTAACSLYNEIRNMLQNPELREDFLQRNLLKELPVQYHTEEIYMSAILCNPHNIKFIKFKSTKICDFIVENYPDRCHDIPYECRTDAVFKYLITEWSNRETPYITSNNNKSLEYMSDAVLRFALDVDPRCYYYDFAPKNEITIEIISKLLKYDEWELWLPECVLNDDIIEIIAFKIIETILIDKNKNIEETIGFYGYNNIHNSAKIVETIMRIRPYDFHIFINKLRDFPIPARVFNKCNGDKLFLKICVDDSYFYNFYDFKSNFVYDEVENFNSKSCTHGGFHFTCDKGIEKWKSNLLIDENADYDMYKVYVVDDDDNFVSISNDDMEWYKAKAGKIMLENMIVSIRE